MTEFDKLKKIAEAEVKPLDARAIAEEALKGIAAHVEDDRPIELGALVEIASLIFLGLRNGAVQSSDPEQRSMIAKAFMMQLARGAMVQEFEWFMKRISEPD